MRFRLPLGRTLFFVSTFLFALVALVPLRFAVTTLSLDQAGFAARDAEGSIWGGLFREAQWNGGPLGDVHARLATLPLLTGQARVKLDSPDGPSRIDGALVATRHSLGIADMTAQIAAPGFLNPLPIASLALNEVDARFSEESCITSKGNVTATLAPGSGLPLVASLSGIARCDGGALLLPLRSPDGSQTVEIRLFPNGRYTLRLTFLATAATIDQALAAAGFVATASGYTLERQGHF